jgi:hypothetical protein
MREGHNQPWPSLSTIRTYTQEDAVRLLTLVRESRKADPPVGNMQRFLATSTDEIYRRVHTVMIENDLMYLLEQPNGNLHP